jgi:CRISPR-associated endonuclease/helicase Cas3
MVVALPTQITSNAMRKTLADLSSGNQVGIFHGRSFSLLKEERKRLARHTFNESDDLECEDLEEIQTENYMGKVYHKPITVSTTDHLVYSLVHGYSQADHALGNLQRAALVFDEAHYYEHESLECLISVLAILRRMGIPHLVMSGTLPSFFVNKVNEENAYKILDDMEGQNLTPFLLERRLDEHMIVENFINERVLEQIVANYKNGLRQFVILNTVTRAKRFYNAMKIRLGPFANLVLHHSQLAFNDRSKKEEMILSQRETRPFILVATQIIEISLNISCDVMFTEIAPADALGQRGGRLNRGGAKPNTNSRKHTMHVFGVEKALPYDQGLLDRTRKFLFDGPVSYSQITEICNEVYQSVRLCEHGVFRSLFSDSTLFGRPYWDIASEDEEGRAGFQFRPDDEYQMVSVIPEALYKNDEHNLTTENEVRIPLWILLKYQDDPAMFYQVTRSRGKKESVFWVCKTPYNGEVGFLEEAIPESETFGSNIV